LEIVDIIKKSMKVKNLKQKLFYIIIIGFSIFILFFVITCTLIGYEAKSQCADAKREYSGSLPIDRQDCVEALITFVKDKNNSYRSRNSAIWALGQFGDSRALPVLQSFYTGNIPSREPLDKSISQYELKKAIKLASGGFNMTAFIWRNGNIEK